MTYAHTADDRFSTTARDVIHCPLCGRGLCWYRDGAITLRDPNPMRRPPELMVERATSTLRGRQRFRCGNPECRYEQVVHFERLWQRLAQAQAAGRTELTLGVDL